MRPAISDAGHAALGTGDFAAVRRLADALIAADNEQAEGYFLRGVAEAEAGRIRDAIAAMEQAIRCAPCGEYRAQLARLYSLVRRDGDAVAVLRAAETAPPDDTLARDTMGCVYARLGNHHAALPHFVFAVGQAPDNDQFRYNYAVTLSFLGRVIEAEAELEVIIARSPNNARAHHLLAGLQKQTPAHNHIGRLRTVHDRAVGGSASLLTGYALAKELEDVGLADEALERLITINAAHRAQLSYDFSRDAAVFDAVERSWSDVTHVPVSDAPTDAPILIIGMPRTGTTLVDRILASHPGVESIGELQALPLAIKAAAGTRTRMVLDAETIAAAAGRNPAAIGHDYLARAGHYRRDRHARFIDKFPANFFYAGTAARAIPNAAIVCLRRNPMDTILANFRNLFATGSRYYDYSYDLLDIAAYYVRFDRLMTFWGNVVPGRVFELSYDALIDDQEGETRKLLAHCGLDWSANCLDFHHHTGAVSTPSAAQVRRPIYRDSVARWRNHENALLPVRDYLESHGIDVD